VSAPIDYPALLRRATLGMVRELLEGVAAEGLPGDHHFFVTFRSGHPAALVPPSLARQYPETMTVVLQHQFWELAVEPEAFEVTLRFGGAYERLRVPFEAITAFLDPSVPFGLDFDQFARHASAAAAGAGAADAAETAEAAATAEHSEENTEAEPPGTSGDVLPFRRRDD
jgi:hypothetical protein